jgi:glycosyltransferase involved in cell wall biosynthesis
MTSKIKGKIFILFLTRNSSLENWEKSGTLDRELKIYCELSKRFNVRLLIFSYGVQFLENKLVSDTCGVFSMPDWLYRIRPRRLRNLIHLFRFVFAYHGERGIIQSNQLSGSFNALLCSKFLGFPFILRMGYYYTHFLGYTLKSHSIFFERFLFLNSSKIIVTNPVARNFIDRLIFSKTNVHYIPNFVDTIRFIPCNNFEAKYDFIYVGRFEERKGSRFFLELLVKYQEKKFLLITKKFDLDKWRLSQYKNLHIINTLKNEDLPNFMTQSKVMVAFSDYEGCPKSYLEAVSCGCNLLYREAPGMSEFFGDFLEPYSGSINENANCNPNEERWYRHKVISSRFSYEFVYGQFHNIYRDFL